MLTHFLLPKAVKVGYQVLRHIVKGKTGKNILLHVQVEIRNMVGMDNLKINKKVVKIKNI